MKNSIRDFFHPDHIKKLESQLDVLSTYEINWIISDIKEANNVGKDFQITNMKFNSGNKSIDLRLREKKSGESITRDLIL